MGQTGSSVRKNLFTLIGCQGVVARERLDPNANDISTEALFLLRIQVRHELNTHTTKTVGRHPGERDKQGLNTQEAAGDWTQGNRKQVDTMRAGLAITQQEPIRNRADNHRDRKSRKQRTRETGAFKIRLNNSGS